MNIDDVKFDKLVIEWKNIDCTSYICKERLIITKERTSFISQNYNYKNNCYTDSIKWEVDCNDSECIHHMNGLYNAYSLERNTKCINGNRDILNIIFELNNKVILSDKYNGDLESNKLFKFMDEIDYFLSGDVMNYRFYSIGLRCSDYGLFEMLNKEKKLSDNNIEYNNLTLEERILYYKIPLNYFDNYLKYLKLKYIENNDILIKYKLLNDKDDFISYSYFTDDENDYGKIKIDKKTFAAKVTKKAKFDIRICYDYDEYYHLLCLIHDNNEFNVNIDKTLNVDRCVFANTIINNIIGNLKRGIIEKNGIVCVNSDMHALFKVKYLGSSNPLKLINGKNYEVIEIENGWYRIIDETNEDYLNHPSLFEIII